MTNRIRTTLVIWLGICAGLVFVMVLLGGAVRLTGSGLSMVDWKPLMGILPPLDEGAWTRAFLKYQQFPEYKIVNSQIDLGHFKFIYLMEYSHRILGRLIGLVFFVPFIYFLITGKLDSVLKLKLWTLFAMGAVQGGVGWFMVKSGLVDNPQVSQYRLALHLIIAVVIFASMIRVIVGLLPGLRVYSADAKLLGFWVIGAILLMITSGGFVAGTHAGFIYNTFPKMAGQWIPDQIGALSPVWRNFLENPVTIQFFHRCLAMIVLILVAIYASLILRKSRNHQQQYRHRKFAGIGLLAAVILQIGLGISTLVLGVPTILGVAHQGGALILLAIAVIAVSSQLPLLVEDRD